jgi:hypothetical protein
MEIVIGETIIYKKNNGICVAKLGYEPDDKDDIIMFNLNDASADRIRRTIKSVESNHQTFNIEYFICDLSEEDEILSKGLDFNDVALFDSYYSDLLSHLYIDRDKLTYIAIQIIFDDLKDIKKANRTRDFKYSLKTPFMKAFKNMSDSDEPNSENNSQSPKEISDSQGPEVSAILKIIYTPFDGVKIGDHKIPNFRLAYAYVTNIFSKEIEGRKIKKILVRGTPVTIEEFPDYLNMYMDIMFSY